MNGWLQLKSRPLPGGGRKVVAIASELLAHAGELTEEDDIVEAALIGARGAVSSLASLPMFSGLRSLSLEGINDVDARRLAAAKAPALRTLELPDGDLSAVGVQALTTATWVSGLSRFLVCGHPTVDDDAIKVLADSELPQLSELSLHDCNVGPEGAAALADSKLPALRELDLGNTKPWRQSGSPHKNHIGAEGAKAIAAADWIGRIEVLKLSHNSIGDNGAEALAAALTAGTHVDLQHNEIGPKGAEALAASSWARDALLGLLHNRLVQETTTVDTVDTVEDSLARRRLTAAEIKSRYKFQHLY